MSADQTNNASLEQFSKRVFGPMVGMVVAAILMVVGFAIFTAVGQNRMAVESSTALAKTALQVKERELARNLRDYAVWDDAYANLSESFDFSWASTDGNVGANLFNGLGYDIALVVGPDSQVVYSVVDGVPEEGAGAFAEASKLASFAGTSRTLTDPVVGLLRTGAGVLLVSATPILPGSGDAENIPVEHQSVLVFAKKLSPTFLERVSRDYLLRNLHLADVTEGEDGTAQIPLTNPAGEVVGQLKWTPELPGYELLKALLPPLGLAAVALAIFAWVVLINARKSTKALEESSKTVQAFAQTLQESEARFRDVAEASSDWIWECDKELRLVYFSSRFSQVTGIAAASVLGKSLERFFFSDTDAAGWTRLIADTQQHTAFRDVRCCYRDAKALTRVCRLAGRPIFDHNSAFIGFRGTATDITEEVEAQARAHHMALHDSLTGLPNRVLFRERLELALGQHAEERSRIAILCLDLDHFKEVNDTLGHGAGDRLLQQVADRLKSCVRPADTVARLGGDEFAIIQVGVNQPLEVSALSRRVMELIKAPFEVDNQELYVGVSIGVALPEREGDDPERLLKNADIALYRAKQSGRGMVRFFEAQMDIELQARKALEYDLRQALLKDELEVFYQPVIDLEGRAVTAVEALLRWHHPTRGLVSPGDFIPLAEETGLIIAIGEWVLRTACTQALQWPNLRVAVNLSPVQFRNRDIIETVQQALSETGLAPERLELEITESILINDTGAALQTLTALKMLGVHIAMDDFGTGYSSLGYLNSFPFDKIKIDRSFISSMSDTEKSTAIVRSVISLGQSMSMTTTAEGVETLEQADFLKQEGCMQVQGFFFGRPVPAEDLTAFLASWQGFEKIQETAA